MVQNKKSAALAIYLRRRSRAVSIVLPSGSDEQPSLALATSRGRSRRFAGLRELSTSGVHSPHVTTRLVGPYPTFSPLPLPLRQRRFFSSARASPRGLLPVR